MGMGFHVFVPLPQLMLMAVLNCLFDSLSQMLRYVFASGIFRKYYIIWNKHFWINETCFITLQKKCGEEGFIGEYGGPFSSSGWNCWWRVSKNEMFKMFLLRHGWEKDEVWDGWMMLYCLLQGDSGERPPASGAPCGPQSMSFFHLRNIQHWVGSIMNKLTHETLSLGGRCAFDRADRHPGKAKKPLLLL